MRLAPSSASSSKPENGNFLLVAILSWLLSLSAVYGCYREIAPFLGFSSKPEKFEALRNGDLSIGISSYAHRIILEDCKEALFSLTSIMLPAADRQAIAKTCSDASGQIAQASPADAFAAIISSYASGILGDGQSAKKKLDQSRALAPFELWLAQLRLRTSREWFRLVGGIESETTAGDVRTVGMTAVGRSYLARWYVDEPQSRSFIVKALESSSSVDQKAFVEAVRIEMKNE